MNNLIYFECKQFVQYFENHAPGISDINIRVQMFVLEKIWSALPLDARCGKVRHFFGLRPNSTAKKNISFLVEKIRNVIMDHQNQGLILKSKITRNCIINFSQLLTDALRCVEQDCQDLTFQNLFLNGRHQEIKSITPLGQETHNQGKIPLLITFKNNVKIVYKPRSLASENIICGLDGIFSKLGFGSYQILDKGTYGYAAFISNTGNVLEETEVDEYTEKLFVIDKLARRIFLSDLHSTNIIVHNKTPYIIDTEVVMTPKKKFRKDGPQLLDDFPLAGYKSNTYIPDNSCKNIIFIKKSASVSFCSLKIRTKKKLNEENSLAIIHSNIQQKKSQKTSKQQAVVKQNKKIIDKAIEQLKNHRHRIVLLATDLLMNIITKPVKKGHKIFLDELSSQSLKDVGFQWTLSSTKANIFYGLYKQDILNNDVPIFYHNPKTSKVFYHKLCIGHF